MNADDGQVWVQQPQPGQYPASVAGLAASVNDIVNYLGYDPTAQRYVTNVGGFSPSAAGTVWSAATGGFQITDLTKLDNSPWAGGTFLTDSFGVAAFKTPATFLVWYVDFGAGRTKINPIALFQGVVNSGDSTTANRPNAVIAGTGGMWFDTTLHKPIWSDGSIWRDATGTAV
jgi:hypothetical protein